MLPSPRTAPTTPAQRSSGGYVRRAERVVYENPWVRFEAHEIVHPNGQAGEHGLVRVPKASGIVVLDGDDVLLAAQARYAMDARFIEIVKGGAAPGEDVEACARREVREEIGVEAQRWTALGVGYEIPSIVAGGVHLFLAQHLRAVAADPEEVEQIETVRMPFDEAVRLALEGGLDDALTVVALLRARHALTR